MKICSLNGTQFACMVLTGAEYLMHHVDHINSLNVFPVPDGDTGTNMNLTMTAGVNQLKIKQSASIGLTAEILAKGLLMGARGNSGVILSQLFRGFSRSVEGKDDVTSLQFACALQSGVDLAYQAVVKPVEGTILTVAKEVAQQAVHIARHTSDFAICMREIVATAKQALAKTQYMLPILKQVGVVDSGGQGLVYFYEGCLAMLEEKGFEQQANMSSQVPTKSNVLDAPFPQMKWETADIEFLYDMEFFIIHTQHVDKPFHETNFQATLAQNGDSIIIIADKERIKVHVHTRNPGQVLDLAMEYGELTQICILNMREQHRELIQGKKDTGNAMSIYSSRQESVTQMKSVNADVKAYGVVVVAMGEGIHRIFTSLGVDIVLAGGQTMNPSIQDFLAAVNSIAAHHIFILPNNSNTIMAARQAAELAEQEVTVLASKTIPEGIAAVLAFQENEDAEANYLAMDKAMQYVSSGQVTYAIRNTTLDGLEIKAGHYIGIANGDIVSTTESVVQTLQQLMIKLMERGGEIITILVGEGADEKNTTIFVTWLYEQYPTVEVEIQQGGQPIYSYLISVE